MKARVPEKVEQAHIIQLLRSIGGVVYVIGHPSPNDGRTHRGTGQTPGIPDLLAFLPHRQSEEDVRTRFLLFVEAKSSRGRLSDPQKDFRTLCLDATVAHVAGTLDAVIAWLLQAGLLKRENVPHYRLPAEAHS